MPKQNELAADRATEGPLARTAKSTRRKCKATKGLDEGSQVRDSRNALGVLVSQILLRNSGYQGWKLRPCVLIGEARKSEKEKEKEKESTDSKRVKASLGILCFKARLGRLKREYSYGY